MSEVAPFDKDASWNVDTLKRYIDAVVDGHIKAVDISFAGRDKAVEAAFIAQEKAVATALNAQKEAVAAALTAQKEAVNKAEGASEKRFESVNEFRAQLNDQNKTFATRSDFDNLKEQLNEVKLAQSKSDNKDAGIGSATDRLFQIVPILIALALAALAFWSVK